MQKSKMHKKCCGCCCRESSNGNNGTNGSNGPNGTPGSPGIPGTLSNVQEMVNSVIPFTNSLLTITNGENLPFSLEVTPATSSFAVFSSPGWIINPGKYWMTITIVLSHSVADNGNFLKIGRASCRERVYMSLVEVM